MIKQPSKAIKDYTNAIQLAPNYLRAYMLRGVAYFHLKQYEKALYDFELFSKNGGRNSKAIKYQKLSREALRKQN